MALSDPTNVRLGLARKQELLKKLAAQMGANGGARAGLVRAAGGRAQGTGSQFQSAVNLRTGGAARATLPFDLPANRARPAGFDPDQSGGNPWLAAQSAAVTPSGPPAGGGGAPVGDAVPVQPAPVSYTEQGIPQYSAPQAPGGADVDPGFWMAPRSVSSAQYDPSQPLTQAGPDPYTLMADAQLQRIIRGRNVAV